MRAIIGVTAVAATIALLAAACSSNDPPEASPTARPTSTPLPTATADMQRTERAETLAELQTVPGVLPVLDAIEARDASTLVDQMYRHRGYCEWPTPTAGAVVPAERAHLASAACYRGEVRYRGIRVEGASGGLWAPLATRTLLDEVFRPGHSWSFAGVTVEEYQTVTDSGLEERVRYLLRFESEQTVALQLPGADIPVALITLTIDLDAASAPQPDAIVELRLDEHSTDQRVRIEIDSGTPAPPADVSPTVRARLEATPELAEVLPALEDLDALIAAMGPFETQCIKPPAPGKSTPENCDQIGNPPDRIYEAVRIDRGESFPIAVERLRAMLEPMFAGGPPPILGAWHLDDSIDPLRERYYVALGGPRLTAGARDDRYAWWDSWDALMVVVDPSESGTVEFISALTPDWTAARYVESLVRNRIESDLTDLTR